LGVGVRKERCILMRREIRPSERIPGSDFCVETWGGGSRLNVDRHCINGTNKGGAVKKN